MKPVRVGSRMLSWSAALLGAVLAVQAAPSSGTLLAGASHGGLLDGSVGAILPLAGDTFLAAALGPDGSITTADDEILLVTGVGGTPVVTALPTPYLSDYSGSLVRLSATRALAFGSGPDGGWGTADDVVLLLDRLGSANTVTPITVGGLGASDAHAPEALASDTAVLSTSGPDNDSDNADDTVAILTGLGSTNTVTHLAAPFVPSSGRSRPVALTATSFLVSSDGPDGDDQTADDVVYLFTDAGGANTRTDLATPFLYRRSPSRAVRLAATRAVVSAAGPDGSFGTTDDIVHLLDGLDGGATPATITPITVGSLFDYGSGLATALTPDSFAIATRGADMTDGTADDGVVVVTGVGTTNTVSTITLNGMDEDGECRPVRLSADSFLVVTGGADDSVETTDDEVVVVTGAGTANATAAILVPTIAEGISGKPVALSPTSFLVNSGGADGSFGGGTDDAVVLVSGIGGVPVAEVTTVDAPFTQTYGLQCVPVHLGSGRAALVSMGADGSLGTADDTFFLLGDLPTDRNLLVQKAAVKFNAAKPEKGEKVSFKSVLSTGGDPFFGGGDVTVSVGNASQTLPAGSFTEKNGNFKYSDPKRLNGFVQKVSFKAKKGVLTLKGKGVGTGAETTAAGHLAVAIDNGTVHLAVALSGAEVKSGIAYKAPKE